MFKKYLRVMYALWAQVYDSVIDPLFNFNRSKVVNLLPLKGGDHNLEIGVGTGLNLPFYPSHCKVTGVDISQAMLAKARKKLHEATVELTCVDAATLPFKDNSFDHALATYVLRVSPDPRKVLEEASRVVKTGGRFVVVDQFSLPEGSPGRIMNFLTLSLGWGQDHDLEELIQGTGWKTISNEKIGMMMNTCLITLENVKR